MERDLRAAAGRLERRRPGRHLLVRPGADPDVIWYGRADSAFAGRAVTVQGTYQPLMADFNGDGQQDILWYGPGADSDVLWLGLGERRVPSSSVNVKGTYQPLLGDWNGDHSRDILWYGPGRRPRCPLVRPPQRTLHRPGGSTCEARTSRSPATSTPTAGATSSGTRRALAATSSGTDAPTAPSRARRGHHRGDLPARRRGLRWRRPERRLLVRARRPRRLPLVRARQPAVHRSGDHPGHRLHPSRRCRYPRSPHQRVQPLRVRRPRLRRHRRARLHQQPGGVPAQLRARASGSSRSTWSAWPTGRPAGPRRAGGQLRPEQALHRGDLGGSGRPQVPGQVHDPARPGPGQAAPRPPRRVRDPRLQVVSLDIYRSFAAARPERSLRERILPHVEDRAELTAFRTVYPVQNYVMALYHTQARNLYDDPIVADFTSRYRTPAVMMWWRDRNLSLSLAANHRAEPPLPRVVRQRAGGPPARTCTCTALPTPARSSVSGTWGSASTPTSRSRPSAGPQHCNRSRKRH